MITESSILLEAVRLRLDTGCPLRCFFCNSWQEKPVRITEDVLRSLVAAARENGASSIAISGGEPLISPMLDSVLRIVQDVGLPAHVTTSGIDLTAKAAALAASGVTEVHLSLESLVGKTRMSPRCELTCESVSAAIDACKSAGLHVEINYLALRGRNWDQQHSQHIVQFCVSRGVDLTFLDLLFSWNEALEQFHVPCNELRRVLTEDFCLPERVVTRGGVVQTEFAHGDTQIRLRDFRAKPSPALCNQCASDTRHLGITPLQLSTAGTLGLCRHRRVPIGDTPAQSVEAYQQLAQQIRESRSLEWIRN